mmetsp:Transcript_36530/g.91583  ORF Transcript_36530/g.91583 Transcript_36530/m.91583 type:complete len:344 (+) Transcript_36530:347-1378(+)
MGCGPSAMAAKEEPHVADTLRLMKKKYQSTLTTLILGAGSSGKSTIIKHFQILTGNLKKEARQLYARGIHTTAVQQMNDLVRISRTLNHSFKPENEENAQELILCDFDSVALKHVEMVAALWDDPGILKTWEAREHYMLDESTQYVKDNIARIKKADYVPTNEDCLHVRRRTVGIFEIEIPVGGYILNFVDVGGQRSERRKWIAQFDRVQTLLYVVALDEYDLNLFEDHTVNRLFEGIKLFSDIVKHRALLNLPIILFFNKYDLLEKKIEKSPLSAVLGEYQGGTDPREAYKYIRNLYMQQLPPDRPPVYDHITTAVDEECMKKVWSSISAMLMEKTAKEDLI